MKIAVFAAVAFATAASAQQQIIVGPQPMVVGQASGTMLLTGTEVRLRLLQELTTKDKRAKVGQRFDLEVAEPVTLNGTIIIPVGSRAVGEITMVRNKGMWGKSGAIEGRFLYARANNRQIRLTGSLDDKGKAGGVGAAAATLATVPLLPVAGFFVTGTSARIAPGTTFVAYLDEDMPVVFAGAQVQPLVVQQVGAEAAGSTKSVPK